MQVIQLANQAESFYEVSKGHEHLLCEEIVLIYLARVQETHQYSRQYDIYVPSEEEWHLLLQFVFVNINLVHDEEMNAYCKYYFHDSNIHCRKLRIREPDQPG